ncbi:YbjN domain-containing protein [Mobiluncus mulieris]|uniref:YbjN domain-containing protein n=2 Tax=Mobiluncus mulieris TaxID=2052 RepID=UPI0020163F33|nr:YbjN domain-containing protein [Mobiluncus mulieris]
MPQMTMQCPQAVTLDRICDALDSAGRNYVVDVCSTGHMLMIPCSTATSYIDLVTGVLRLRSVWRGAIPTMEKPELYPYILRHNREVVGPKAMIYEHGDYLHVSTQTSFQVTAGMGSQQLEASLLLALIMVERFTHALESSFQWVQPEDKYIFHRDMLQKQHVLQVPSAVSKDDPTQRVDGDFVDKTCNRLHLRTQRDGSVFHLLDAPRILNSTQETVLRLFGEDTWFSVSALVRLPHSVPPEELFLAVNNSNIENALGEISILGLRRNPYLRVDYLIPTGEGLSMHQLDTQILVGVGVSTDLLTRLGQQHPKFFA